MEEFFKRMTHYEGSHEEFDFLVLPVVEDRKNQTDTINTIRTLQRIGVNRQRIRLVSNKIDYDDSIEDGFAPLFGLAVTENSFVINPKAAIQWNEVYEMLKTYGKSLAQMTADTTDYRARYVRRRMTMKRRIAFA